jgi:hypothetical protein
MTWTKLGVALTVITATQLICAALICMEISQARDMTFKELYEIDLDLRQVDRGLPAHH